MIAVLGSASWANSSTVDPVSRSFTVPSGANRLLVVQSPLDATGVTYSGQAMTRAKNDTTGQTKIDTWYLVNPPVGTANIVWAFGTPWTTGAYSAVVLSEVDQAAPIYATTAAGNAFQSSPMTLTLAPPAGGSLLAFFHSTYASDPTVSAGDTHILFQAGDSRGLTAALTAADDGTIAISGWAGQANCVMVGIALKPAASGGGAAALAGNAADTASAAGALSTGIPLAGAATATASGSGALSAIPTITSEILKTNNGTVEASVALNFVAAYDDSTGALVVRKTGLSTDASGIFRLQDVALTPGTTYRLDWETATGHRRMPRKAAA